MANYTQDDHFATYRRSGFAMPILSWADYLLATEKYNDSPDGRQLNTDVSNFIEHLKDCVRDRSGSQ
jgi:hypothetical protein